MPPPIPAFSLRGSLSPLLLIPIALVFLLAVFAPDDVLARWRLAKRFTDWMTNLAPFLSVHTASTEYPQLALLVNCLTVFTVVALGCVWLVLSTLNYPHLLRRNRIVQPLAAGRHLFIVFFGIPFCLLALYFIVGLPGDPSWARGTTTSSRLGLGFFAALAIYIQSKVLGGWVLLFRLFFDLHSRGENRDAR